MEQSLEQWMTETFNADQSTILSALKTNPSAKGYIHGAVSELCLATQLREQGFEVHRIKEKPSGGFDKKKEGYKGDFLIKKTDSSDYFVVECKGLKSNAEFRSAKTNDKTFQKALTTSQAESFLKKFYNPDKSKIYSSGKAAYNIEKNKWEIEHSPQVFPSFKWNMAFPGPNCVDLSDYFKNEADIKSFVEKAKSDLLTEKNFRECQGLYKVLETHQPNTRKDEITGIKQAAPLVSDFSIMAVDLFLRIGEHKFVFMNPNEISHSPTSPNHLYQNYIIDIIIPGKKDDLKITPPWYENIEDCIMKSSPKTVPYDESQLDHR